jgi:D-alanyl-D-alanine carboxypeptidase/D-alanyl-D-alanine-endopeptidase (penicillin-binding protein 4)
MPTPAPLPSTPAPRDPVLAHLNAAAGRPTHAGIAAALRGPARAVGRGAQLVGQVIDGDTGEALWAASAGQPAPPASTTKLLTAAAALLRLGPNARLATTTRRQGDTVYLVGGGDPTIVRDPSAYDATSYPRPATLADLAHQTVAALGARHRVRLRLDATAWRGPRLAAGWKPTYVTEGDATPPSALEVDEGRLDPASSTAPRTGVPVRQAGEVFAALLRQRGVRVIGKPAPATAPVTARTIGRVGSPPMTELVQRMLTLSDDDLAEALGRAVAIHDSRPATFRGAGRAVTAAMRTLRVPTHGVSLQDTSGLSHQDRVPPRTLVAVLRAATQHRFAVLRPILESLPVAGFTGTLQDRYRKHPERDAAGVLRAKTGTLSGVNALAGATVDHSGRLLIFAFLASHAESAAVTVPALDRLAARLAQCGCDRA